MNQSTRFETTCWLVLIAAPVVLMLVALGSIVVVVCLAEHGVIELRFEMPQAAQQIARNNDELSPTGAAFRGTATLR